MQVPLREGNLDARVAEGDVNGEVNVRYHVQTPINVADINSQLKVERTPACLRLVHDYGAHRQRQGQDPE